MTLISNRIFMAFALLCLVSEPVRSREISDENVPKSCQIRKRPSCPADSPQLLSPPWYQVPHYYEHHLSSVNNYRIPMARLENSNYIDQNVPATSISYENQRQSFSHWPSIYSNPSAYNTRMSTSGRGLSAESLSEDSPTNFQPFNPQYSLSSIQQRSLAPQNFSRYNFQPERYSASSEISSINDENDRFPRNKKKSCNRQLQRHYFELEKSSLPDCNKDSLARTTMQEYRRPNVQEATQQIMQGNARKMVHETAQKIPIVNRQKLMKSASQKVYVVYRADADLNADRADAEANSMLDENGHNSKFTETAQLSQFFNNNKNNNVMRAMKSTRNEQLEGTMKRAMEVSDDEHIPSDSWSPQRREICDEANEHFIKTSRDCDRSWNGNIYRRFYPAGLNGQQNRIFYRTRFSPMSRFLPYLTNWNPESIPTMAHGRRISIQGNWPVNNSPERIKMNLLPDIFAQVEHHSGETQDACNGRQGFGYPWGDPKTPHVAKIQEIGTTGILNLESDEDFDYRGYLNCAKKREIYINKDALLGASESPLELPEASESSKPLQPSKPRESLQPSGQKSYRNERPTNALNTESFDNRDDDNEENKSAESNKSANMETERESLKKCGRTPMSEVDPDFFQDMEKPPLSVTESTIQLNLDSLEATTPTPLN